MGTLDTSGMKRRNRVMLGRGRTARRAAIQKAVSIVVKDLLVKAPKDTYRYVRAWAVAGRETGTRGIPVPNIKRSSRQAEYEGRLHAQLAAAERRVESLANTKWAWYDSKPERRKTGYYDKLVRDLRRAEKRVEQAKEQIELARTNETFILIGGRKGKRGTGLSTVRTRIYGGTGQILETNEGTAVRLRNLEPHAKIVESRTKTLKAASRLAASVIGVRSVRKKYLDELTHGDRRS